MEGTLITQVLAVLLSAWLLVESSLAHGEFVSQFVEAVSQRSYRHAHGCHP